MNEITRERMEVSDGWQLTMMQPDSCCGTHQWNIPVESKRLGSDRVSPKLSTLPVIM